MSKLLYQPDSTFLPVPNVPQEQSMFMIIPQGHASIRFDVVRVPKHIHSFQPEALRMTIMQPMAEDPKDVLLEEYVVLSLLDADNGQPLAFEVTVSNITSVEEAKMSVFVNGRSLVKCLDLGMSE